ncbi:TetR/AcrR family transcriptional regulator [Alloalcanivorax xenomutans]|uniref:TetR/AcrR family transcriptional regulator n=1 Tax=Alloalcanivorax xenomutans TaxID=1094342 RepID=UPI001F1B6613|nr:TetR/AcrR family transcriptional regulator [Alloalcanivorax xenomutans]MCE7525068.1 TetR/AcrR family transcriptional regulator [Alloalcanivorax xenomutans]
MAIDSSETLPGQRGPADHERRTQILQVADELFRVHGYRKTSVTDIAKAIGVSSAYLYRFFDSKQAIGEAVCAMALSTMGEAIRAVAERDASATQRLRDMLHTLLSEGMRLFLKERCIHDIVVVSIENQWAVTEEHNNEIYEAIEKIVSDGRESGEFERKTPLDEVCMAIRVTAAAYAHPVLLNRLGNTEEMETKLAAVTNLILRSLAP